MADEFKALTYINLPFIDERYEPGEVISREAFERYEEAAAVIDDRSHKDKNASPLPTAKSEIARLIEWGSLSDDLDAEIHPDHVIPDPNALSLNSLVRQAELLIEQLEAEGKDVPAKLKAMVEISPRQIADADSGAGVDRHA